jgi:hypothetical protein
MKPRSHLPSAKPLALAAALLAGAFAALAAQTHTNAPASSSPVPTNALLVLPEIPQSAFVIPTNPQEGKDPFFPRSTRLFASVVVKTNLQTTTAVATVELHLNGISGTADHRLAIINNQTFETNEEGDVPTNLGRAHIRCLEIKADSVLIQVGGEQRILRLRSGL